MKETDVKCGLNRRRAADASEVQARKQLILQTLPNDFGDCDCTRLKLTSLPRYDELRRDAEVHRLPGTVSAVVEGCRDTCVCETVEKMYQLFAGVSAP